MQVKTILSLEIEVELEGTYIPGQPATPPSYASGGDPPVDPSVEDVTITRIGILHFDARKTKWATLWVSVGADDKISVADFISATGAEEALILAAVEQLP